MTYAIEVAMESGESRFERLNPQEVKSKRMAIRAINNFLNCGRIAGDVYLTFHRQSDGQNGYVNPGGSYAIIGRPWN